MKTWDRESTSVHAVLWLGIRDCRHLPPTRAPMALHFTEPCCPWKRKRARFNSTNATISSCPRSPSSVRPEDEALTGIHKNLAGLKKTLGEHSAGTRRGDTNSMDWILSTPSPWTAFIPQKPQFPVRRKPSCYVHTTGGISRTRTSMSPVRCSPPPYPFPFDKQRRRPHVEKHALANHHPQGYRITLH